MLYHYNCTIVFYYIIFIKFILGMVLLKQALEEKVEKFVSSDGNKEKEMQRIEEAPTMELFRRAFDRDKVCPVCIGDGAGGGGGYITRTVFT